MKYRVLSLVLFCFAVSAFAQLNVRNFKTKNDMEINAEQDEDIEWYQAEQVQYDIKVRRGRARVNIPTNATPVWRVWAAATPTTLVVNSTGTVISASDGHVRFTLTPEASNAATGTYVSLADVFIGSTNIGTIASSAAIIRYSPRSTNVAYSGTVALESPFYVVAGDTLEGNMNAGGYAITNAGAITSTGTITGNLFSGDGGSLTNITATAALTPWTGQVDAAQFALTNLESVTVGSNTFEYIASSPLQIRARGWTGAVLAATNVIDTGVRGTEYAVPIIAGEDAGLAIISEYEGAHGSFLELMNLKSNTSEFGHSAFLHLAQTNNTHDGQFAIDVNSANTAGSSIINMPFIITTSKVVQIGGPGRTPALGLEVYGQMLADYVRMSARTTTTNFPAATHTGTSDIQLDVYGEDAMFVVGSEANAATWGSIFVLRDYNSTNGVKNSDFYMARTTSETGGDSDWMYLGYSTNTPPETDFGTAHMLFRGPQGFTLFQRSEGVVITGPLIQNSTLTVGNTTTSAGVIQISEDDDFGSNLASFTVPALAANTVYTLPPDDGDASEVLQTDGSGVLTWVAQSGGGNPIDGRSATGTVDMAGNILTNAATIAGTNFVIGTSGSLTGADLMTLAVSQSVAQVINAAVSNDLTIGTISSGSNVLFSANVILNSNLNVTGTITGPGSGITAVDAATLDTLDSLAFIKADGSVAMSGAFNVGNNTITNLATPTANDHATTKAYVDAADATPPTNTAVYGVLYIHDGSVTQTVPNGVYTQLVSWTTGEVAGVTLTTSNISVASDGTYLIQHFICGSVDSANETLEGAIHVEDVHQNEGEWKRDMAINDSGCAAGSAILTLTAGDAVDIRIKNVGLGTADFLIEQAQFHVSLLSSVTAGTNWAQHAAAGNVNLGGNTITSWGATTVDNNLTVNSNLVAATHVDSDGNTIRSHTGGATGNLVMAWGDVDDAGNGAKITLAESTKVLTFTSTAQDLAVQVNGTLNVSSDTTIDGDLDALVKVFTTATNRTWTTDELRGAMIFVTGTSTQTLSNVTTDGHSATFQTVGTFTATIDPNAADYITLDGTIGTAGQAIVSPGTSGDLITIISSDTTNWMTVGRSAVWTQP